MKLPFVIKDGNIQANFDYITKFFNQRNSSLVSVLPSNPVDGQEAFVQTAGMAAVAIVWRVRWRAAVAVWEYIGGGPWVEQIVNPENRANAAFGDLPTVGPQITIPFTGSYFVGWGARIQLTVAGVVEGSVMPAVNGVGFGGGYSMGHVATAQFGSSSCYQETPRSGLLVIGDNLRLLYATQASLNFVFSQRTLRILPAWIT